MRSYKFTLAISAAMSVSTFAHAGNTLDMLGLVNGGSTYTETISDAPLNVTNANVYAGPFNASYDGGSTIQVYCVDILDETQFNVLTPVAVQNTAGLTSNYQNAARLLNAFGASANGNLLDEAGLQVAIWKTVFPDLAYTDFWQAGVTTQANYYLGQNVSNYSDKANFYNYNGANQNMMGTVATPEPAPVMALGLGVFGVGILRRRRKA